ncbi:MAG: hypothetical protein QW057_08830 [Candidatus Bathyarchaeia archaeon]
MRTGIGGLLPRVYEAVPPLILVLLLVGSLTTPVFFRNTLGPELYRAVSPMFWAALGYGLVFPFASRRGQDASEALLWGTLVFGLFWGYFVVAEPGVRYWDSFAHSEVTCQLVTAGVKPELNRYLLWPSSFILHGAFGALADLPALEASKLLAFAMVLLIGAALMRFFLLFFNPRYAFLSLIVFSLTPNSLMLHHQHYSPQTVAYFLSLLILALMYRGFDEPGRMKALFILLLFGVVMLHPVTSLLLFPVLTALLAFNRVGREPSAGVVTGGVALLFLTAIAAWWLARGAALDTSISLLSPSLRRLWDAVTLGEYRFTEGLFRPVHQPAYSQVIRDVTFVLLSVAVAPSLLRLARSFLRAARGSRRLKRDEAFFLSILLGTSVGTILVWTATGGLYGDRSWGLAAPVIAILCTRSLVSKPADMRMRQAAGVLAVLAVALVPLNFVAVNYMESQRQTSLAEMAAVEFIRFQGLRYQWVFSDSELTLIRLRYAFQDGSNIFLKTELLPETAGNSSFLAAVPWTYFVHTERSTTLLLSHYGEAPDGFKEFGLPGVVKAYDNGELKVYRRAGPPL